MTRDDKLNARLLQLQQDPLRRVLLLLLDQLDRDLGAPRDGELSDLRRQAQQLLDDHPR